MFSETSHPARKLSMTRRDNPSLFPLSPFLRKRRELRPTFHPCLLIYKPNSGVGLNMFSVPYVSRHTAQSFLFFPQRTDSADSPIPLIPSCPPPHRFTDGAALLPLSAASRDVVFPPRRLFPLVSAGLISRCLNYTPPKTPPTVIRIFFPQLPFASRTFLPRPMFFETPVLNRELVFSPKEPTFFFVCPRHPV